MEGVARNPVIRACRWLAYGLVALLSLLLLAIGLATVLVNPDDYKPQLEKTAQDNGITLKIGGSLHWSLLPLLGFSTSDIEIQLPPQPDEPIQHIRIEKLSLAVGILPLLRGNLQIGAFDIDNLSLSTADKPTLHFTTARLKVDDANNRGEPFPIKLQIDDTSIAGKIAVNTTPPLQLHIDLHGDQIDLDRYTAMSETAEAGAEPAAQTSPEKQKKPAGNDKQEEPMQLASLLQAQGTYRLQFDQMKTGHLQLANVLFDATVEPSRIVLNAFNANLYQGHITNTGTIELPADQQPILQLAMRIEKVQLAPLLVDLLQETPAVSAGVLDLDADITGHGATHRKIMRTLSGTASLDVNGVVLRNTNLEKLSCDAAASAQKRDPVNKHWPADTLLHNLHGEAKIINGIALINPITARLDTMKLTGNGPVNLVSQTLDLKLDVMVLDINSANSCDAISPALRDVAWPVRCEGNYLGKLDNLCAVDKSRLGKLVADIALKNLGKGETSLKDTLRSLFH